MIEAEVTAEPVKSRSKKRERMEKKKEREVLTERTDENDVVAFG